MDSNVLAHEVLFSILEQTTSDGMFIHDGQIILDSNKKFLDITGYSKKDFINKDPLILVHPEYRSIAREHILNHDENPYEAILTGKNGLPINVELQGKYVITTKGMLRIVIVRNIARIKTMEEDLIITKDKLAIKFKETKRILRLTVDALSSTIRFNDPYTWKHQLRTAELCKEIGQILLEDRNQIEALVTAAKLHDIGKLSIPKDILIKPTKLTVFEYGMIKEHPGAGFDIIKMIPFCQPVALYIVQHHEALDGSGYPFGLEGDDIEIPSRILSVVDVFEAVSSHRPYRPALGFEYAINHLEKFSGTKYDPDIVACCKDIVLNRNFRFLNDYKENYDLSRS